MSHYMPCLRYTVYNISENLPQERNQCCTTVFQHKEVSNPSLINHSLNHSITQSINPKTFQTSPAQAA
jgi:hypothetical protein